MGKSKISKEAKSTSSLLKKKLSLKKKKKFKDVNSIASPTAVVPAQKGLKRKRIMGPCPDIQLRIGADEFIPDIGDENDGGDKIVEEEEMHIENDVDVEAVQEEEMHMETDFSDKIVEEEEVHVENDGDLEVVEEDEIQATKPTKKRKSNKVRGRSVMKGLGLKFKKAKKVRFNQNDQPVGKNSVKLSSFLGVLVRRKLSLNNRDWRKVKQEVKDNLWAAVKRFIIDDYYKPYYVGKMGCLLKEARSRTAKLVFAAYLLEEEERNQKLDIAKPDNMTSCEWEEFIEYVRSPTFKVKRRVMQEVRENHNTPHTIS